MTKTPKIVTNEVLLFIWLPHLAGAIGIAAGFQDWFVTKTVLNLLASFGFFVLYFPITRRYQWILFGTFFSVGMLVEWLGVHYRWFFGTYSYGENLGPKLDGIPFIIGIFWAVLTMITAKMAQALTGRYHYVISSALLGAVLMVGLDVLLELLAPHFDYWTFVPAPGIENYLSWFGFGFLFQLLYFSVERRQQKAQKTSWVIALHIYLAQAIFFGSLALMR
jgi:putative membrane protein